VSYAAEHPVYCARREDLGCTASHPRSRFDDIKANEAGWFSSYQERQSYCPDHVPDWVPGWRESRARRKFEVNGFVSSAPAVLKCVAGDLEGTADGGDEELVRALRARAFAHARETGHVVTVTTTHVLTLAPAGG
jgi:hypothetical protein